MLFEISIFFDKEILLITIGFDFILASSLTGVEAISNALFALTIFNSRGIVIALRHVSVGTTFAYSQLLIHPKNNLRFPVFDQVILHTHQAHNPTTSFLYSAGRKLLSIKITQKILRG